MRMKWAQGVHIVFISKVYRSELCLVRTEKKMSVSIGISRFFVCLFVSSESFFFLFQKHLLNTHFEPGH